MTDQHRVALTDTRLKNLKPAPKGKRYALADLTCPGLKVRINDKGTHQRFPFLRALASASF